MQRPPIIVIAWAGLAITGTATFPAIGHASAVHVSATADPAETVTETVTEKVTETVTQTQTETVTEPGPTQTVTQPGPTVTQRVTVTGPPPDRGRPPPDTRPRPAPNGKPAPPAAGRPPRRTTSGSAGVGTLMRPPSLTRTKGKKDPSPDQPLVLPKASASAAPANIDLPAAPSGRPVAHTLDAWGTDNPALMSWALAVPAAAGALSVLLAIAALRRRIQRVTANAVGKARWMLWGGEPFVLEELSDEGRRRAAGGSPHGDHASPR